MPTSGPKGACSRAPAQRRCRASRIAPSRSPHSLTTNRPTPSSVATVASTTGADREQGCPACLHPRQTQSGPKVEPRQLVGELGDLACGELHLVDLTGTCRRAAPGARRGQAGQRPHRAPAHHGPVGDSPVPGQDMGDRRHGLGRPGPQRDPVGLGQGVTGPELAPEPCGTDGRTGGHRQVLGVPHGRFEAPPAEVQPERLVRARPHPGSLADEAETGLLLPVEDAHRGPDDPLQPLHHLGTVGGVAQRGGGHGDDDLGPGLGQAGPQALGGRHRRRHPVAGDAPPCSHAQAQVEQRPPVQHRGEGGARPRLTHQKMEGAAPEVPHRSSNPHRRERSRPAVAWSQPGQDQSVISGASSPCSRV